MSDHNKNLERKIDDVLRQVRETKQLVYHVLEAVLKLPSGGMTTEEVDALVKRLQAHDNTLKGIALPTQAQLKENSTMAVPQALTDALAKIDTDTTALAAVVTDLRSKVGVGMTQADVDAVQATLAAVATRLEATAKDPNAPVPPGPVPPLTKATKH